MDIHTFTKQDVVNLIVPTKDTPNFRAKGRGIAPINIALCKYWGKRNLELNLPYNSSISVSLPYYTESIIEFSDTEEDMIFLNGEKFLNNTEFGIRVVKFLDLFRLKNIRYKLHTNSAVPIKAGLASSAAGFAALTIALNDLYDWKLSKKDLSILARLGSGSASRSIYEGFVQWYKGNLENGMDSYSEQLNVLWNDVILIPLILGNKEKSIGSREGMLATVNTSPFYKAWIETSIKDFEDIRNAIVNKNFYSLGSLSEGNAMCMHAAIMTSTPSIMYWNSETLNCMQKVWNLRREGLEVYFTIDAGHNVILIIENKNVSIIEKIFHDKIIK